MLIPWGKMCLRNAWRWKTVKQVLCFGLFFVVKDKFRKTVRTEQKDIIYIYIYFTALFSIIWLVRSHRLVYSKQAIHTNCWTRVWFFFKVTVVCVAHACIYFSYISTKTTFKRSLKTLSLSVESLEYINCKHALLNTVSVVPWTVMIVLGGYVCTIIPQKKTEFGTMYSSQLYQPAYKTKST